jgi:ABC-type lipoprotein export system ATPase subunit
MTTPLIRISQLSKGYVRGGQPISVLVDIHLEVAQGEFVALMGPSGSGKSTLLSILGGLESPTSGTVRLDGADPGAMTANERAAYRNRRIGFVFQEHHLLAGCTAVDNVVLPALASGSVHRDIEVRARRLLDRVGLGDRLGSLPAELSGGERQRVAVARALVLSPRVILADEPTGQLDAHAASMVTELLVELAAESGGMLVVVTHAEAVAARVGTVRHLVDGRLVS